MKKFISSITVIGISLCGFISYAAQPSGSFTFTKDASTIKYNPMIFGHFIEHFDTQIYGGLYDPESRFADEDGFRTDVIDALKEIKCPIVRWPGGCFVSSYHWKNGVGPNRIPTFDKSWHVEDPNTFGTDEYVKWCRKVGCEPYICTNAGTGTAEEMSDWVEYCNLSIGEWGRKRMSYGNIEPFDVKYWSIGNENYGPWEMGAKTVDEWGPFVRESAKLMRAVNPDLKLFAAATGDEGWSLPLLKYAGSYLEYLSVHGYWDGLWINNNPSGFLSCMMKTDGPEKSILSAINVLDKSGYRGIIKIAFDEWNLRGWHHPWHGNPRKEFDFEARRKNDINSTYTMADALFSACFLNACLRHADDVEIACFSPIVNTRGALFVHKDGVLKRSTFYVFQMYVNLLEEYVLPISTESDSLNDGENSTKVFDVVLTSDRELNRFACAAVNKDPEKARALKLDFEGLGKKAPKQVKAVILSGRSADDYNDVGQENNVTPREAMLPVKDSSVILPAHSLVLINF